MSKPDKTVKRTRDLYVKAEKIYPRQVRGLFARLRVLSVWMLLGLYYVGPWITWEGRQAILLDLPARQFHIFGITFWPQDFIYLAVLLIIAAVALFFFTALAGRVWCGFACPQTVWTETFIWIERFVEGDRNQRMKLDKAPWSFNKVSTKATKHFLWLSFALFTGYTFVGFFSPIRELTDNLILFNLGPWEAFWIGLYSLATYGNAGFLREQICQYMCPYARFQSAMFDKDTLIISYDTQRGESRGHRKRTDTEYKIKGLGDCIDCKQCVQVCPTGIDIRDGLQSECIACALCIDVCDDVMEKMDYEKGLIRYSTENAMEGKETKVLRPRTFIYGGLLLALIIGFFASIGTRTPLELDVIRDRNRLYVETSEGLVENVYRIKIGNMAQEPYTYNISVDGLPDMSIAGPTQIHVKPGEVKAIALRVRVDPGDLTKTANTIFFNAVSVEAPDIRIETEARFIGPALGR
ncbi:cytochrome c oxidase accessory protein CcoG [Pleionea sp. CnH1-48]|uniref:cytochrome c oxidase accessory protein CcoG n=1 Tax=Pleionea sp. CnH1-48 TaxID=2954494 RepID=UPI0020972E2C|nr:cytochrome c oxidase accessory protein CcoG [Pleionea sp. CnH1-48]MCO7223938.1 cytochrome c oxidase accessory protein CcoG [Pleionea sp. CnH1-48]